MKEKILVVCPGRGTYTASELGYLKRFGSKQEPLVRAADEFRKSMGLSPISALDGAPSYSASIHATSAHAPLLISVCALADFLSLDPVKSEVVAVTGNSMGWYIALAAAGVLTPRAAFRLITTMGGFTAEASAGSGQLIYPVVDEDWHRDPRKIEDLAQAVQRARKIPGVEVYPSIHLGGFEVLAGNDEGIRALLNELPPVDGRYPMKLIHHSAFHTPLMRSASERGLASLEPELFERPQLPLVDGEGQIWQPYSTDLTALREYTLGRQVTEPYDFTASIKVALKEFAPTRIALLGPGSNLGGALGQILVELGWKGIRIKADFATLQAPTESTIPYLVALGREDQRSILI